MSRVLGVSVVLVLVAACSSKTTINPGDGGVHASGIVPPDLRDVERDGEGLFSTTFGPFPDRTPDWARAAGVLSLLKTVWARGKAANPDMPSAQVRMIDDAVAALDKAIPAKDQKSAVFASNQIGLACPELFDYFHEEAPIGVIRLDAVFRQVGLDGHFKDAAGVKKDIASMKSDWANTKDPVAKKAPTCHRVGGTATISGDIDQALVKLDAAIAASDWKSIEQLSEDGALQIDTLELLFDCPPDAVTPDKGLGAKCADDTQCDKGQACDKANAGGKCAPSANNKIGTPCTSTNDCGSDSRSACNTESGDNFKGGYCFMEPCNDVQVCPPGATCVALGGEATGCFKGCATDADCRKAEGYVCQLFLTTPPKGFGPLDHACAFPCTRDADCQSPLTCDIPMGKCKP